MLEFSNADPRPDRAPWHANIGLQVDEITRDFGFVDFCPHATEGTDSYGAPKAGV